MVGKSGFHIYSEHRGYKCMLGLGTSFCMCVSATTTFLYNTALSAHTRVPKVCVHKLFFKLSEKLHQHCLGNKLHLPKMFSRSFLFFIHAVVNKAKMLSAGVAEAVLKFLRSEMPPVQFKLLGTLRMLIDAQGKNKLFSMLSDSLRFSL